MTTLASTLVHFVWQGTLVTLAAAVLLRFGPRAASARYVVGTVALVVMAVTPVATYVALSRVESVPVTVLGKPVGSAPATVAAAITVADTDGGATAVGALAPPTLFEPFVVLAWASGVLLLSIRLVGGWLVARRLASRVVAPAGPGVMAVVARVSHRLGVRRSVRVLQSSTCAVPMVIGWLRPVVLVPVAALAGLPPAQFESLLAHELAHVRRHDYLVNLLQVMLETALFYHPGVWWVSRQVRIEREHCCDDLAVSVCDPVDYASALSALASMTATPPFALAATDGPLLSRVRRLLGQSASPRSAASLWFGLVTAIAVVTLIPVATTAVTTRAAVGESPGAAGAQAPFERDVDLLDAPRTPDVRALGMARTGQMTPPTLSQGEASASPQAVETEQSVYQQLQEAERRLAEVHGERQSAEDARLAEVFQGREAVLMAHLDRLRVAHEESKTRVETGLANAGEARDIQAMIGTVEEELRTLRLEERAREVETQLARRGATLQAEYETLQARYATLLEQRRQAQVDAHTNQDVQLPARSSVIAVSHGPHRAWFEPRLQPYTQGGPAVAFPVAESDGARTKDGRRISRVRFIGWREGDATRVIALVSVPRDGEADTYTADASRLVERDAGTYVVNFGELVALKDLEALGIGNVWISSLSSVR